MRWPYRKYCNTVHMELENMSLHVTSTTVHRMAPWKGATEGSKANWHLLRWKECTSSWVMQVASHDTFASRKHLRVVELSRPLITTVLFILRKAVCIKSLLPIILMIVKSAVHCERGWYRHLTQMLKHTHTHLLLEQIVLIVTH